MERIGVKMRVDLGEVFQYVYDKQTGSLRITDGGSTNQELVDEVSDVLIYSGQGAKGLATSDDGWLIEKIDLSTNPIVIQHTIGVWNNRGSLTYE